MPNVPPISPRSSLELQRPSHPPLSASHTSASGPAATATASATATHQTSPDARGSGAMPAAPRHGSTHALLSRRGGGQPATQPRGEEPAPRASDENAEGATIVQPGNPMALLMNIQQIQSVTGMVQSAEQGLASMTTSASRHAVDAVQDIAA